MTMPLPSRHLLVSIFDLIRRFAEGDWLLSRIIHTNAGGALDAVVVPPVPANEVRLQLSVLAYNLGNLWRRLVLPTRIATWSLTSLQQRLVKTGGRLVKHARYYWLVLAESHLTRRLFGSMLRRIWALPVPTG
jgi:Transposase DDE domain group 1